MALTLVQAIQRLSNPVMQGIIKTIVTTDQMAAMLPIVPVGGDAMRVVREGALPVGGAFIPDTGATTENSTGKHDRTLVEFRRIVGNMDVDYLANIMSGGSELPMQVEKKVKATWRTVQDTIVNGNRITSHTLGSTADPFLAIDATTYSPWMDSDRRGPGSIKYTHAGTLWQFRAPGDPDYGDAVAVAADGTATLYSYNKSKWIRITFDVSDATGNGETHIRFNTTTNAFEGMEQLVDPGMTIDPVGAAGDDYAFSILDRMISMVKVRENLAFCMPGRLLEKHYAACRALGGTTPEFTEIPGIMGKSKVPAYRGIPLLTNDFIPSDETYTTTSDASSIYLASLDANEGLFLGGMTYGGQQVLAEADPRSVPVLGFYFTDVGALEASDHRRTRVGWCGALGLKSPLALARKRGVKTA
jgi:hypothetical protein